jgi:hypothetical protein
MRTLLIGLSAATMVACSCPPLPRQVSLQGCTDANGLTCLDGIAASQPSEHEPVSLNANATTAKTKVAAKAERRSSAHARDKAHAETSTAKPIAVAAKNEPPVVAKNEPPAAAKSEPPAAAKSEPSASSQPAETSDEIIFKAKITVAAKMENPASAEFGDMNRAMRKNTFGQFIDTICGRVKGKKASGEDTGDRPFLYLVEDDEAYVVDSPTGSAAAATAYHNICN